MPKKRSKFKLLLSDIVRFIAEHLIPKDINRFCKVNRKTNLDVCKNNVFMRKLANKYLTIYNNRIPQIDSILRQICLIPKLTPYLLASAGYEISLYEKLEKDKYKSFIDEVINISAEKGHLDIIEHLSPYIASYNDLYREGRGLTLVTAAKFGHLPIVQYLVNLKTPVNYFDYDPLRQAIYNHHWPIVKYLIDRGSNPSIDNDIALKEAIDDNQWNMVEFLIREGVDPSVRQNYLLRKAINKNLFIIPYLLQQNVNQRLVMQLASQKGLLSIVRNLVESGYDIHLNNEEAVRLAVENDRLDIVKYLVKQGADIHVLDDQLILSAAELGYVDILKYFIQELGEKDVDEETLNNAFILAVNKDKRDIIEYLLSLDIDINTNDSEALKVAVENNNLDLVKYLIEHDANVSADDNIALKIAVKQNNYDITKYLLEHDADVHAENDYALRRAIDKKFHKIIELLGFYGAKLDNKENLELSGENIEEEEDIYENE